MIEHEPLDFIAVGVGPLCLDEKYVAKGEPAGNQRVIYCLLVFMAEQMSVVIPPLLPKQRNVDLEWFEYSKHDTAINQEVEDQPKD